MKEFLPVNKNIIILCGFNTFNSYGVLRSLGESKIYPILITNNCKIPFLTKSRYAKKGIYYFNHPADIIEILENEIPIYDTKPIVIGCDDVIQAVLDQNYNKLNDRYILSHCSNTQGEITKLMDKSLQMKIAKECGCDIPKSWHLQRNSSIPIDVIYPCIVKPIISIQGSKSEITICNSELQLQKLLKKNDYLIQEFINKEYEAIIFGTSVGENNYYFSSIAKKIRHYPDSNSLSSFGKLEDFTKHPKINVDAFKRFLQKLNYTGMFSIELAVKNEKYYLLEINLRNDGKQYFSTKAGANLPLIYIKSRLGLPFDPLKLNLPIYYMGETTDFRHVIKHTLSPIRWLIDLFKTDSFFIMNWKDPLPFFYSLIAKKKNNSKKIS